MPVQTAVIIKIVFGVIFSLVAPGIIYQVMYNNKYLILGVMIKRRKK